MSNIHFEVLSVDKHTHCIEVEWFTDVLTKERLAGLNRRFKMNILLPYPAPVGQEFDDFVWRYAPIFYLETMEREEGSGKNNTESVRHLYDEVGKTRSMHRVALKEKLAAPPPGQQPEPLVVRGKNALKVRTV
ncbi:hypothetical protein UFOVP1040_67 [uncultured Caudovirales phage]|uniref:Uncharacterized protein n=1 Tax=uncultured Caudovirales phage TaxID=2100421 RepID=A0A6J5QLS0_9CAUD|nr:hypothetical protein UFOVP1040_67 [uncultured Caudovirales phage]